jgi:hypothetical protein
MGLHGSVARLDGILRADLGRRLHRTAGTTAWSLDATLSYVDVAEPALVPELWGDVSAAELDLVGRVDGGSARSTSFLESRLIGGRGEPEWFGRSELTLGTTHRPTARTALAMRAYGGVTWNALPHRAVLLSAKDPMSTFWNHWWRPRDALLKQDDFHWLPLGGAGLRGFSPLLAAERAAAINADARFRLGGLPSLNTLSVWVHGFGDAGFAISDGLVDAGLGLSVRGRLYDREIVVRLDSPFYVSQPALALSHRSREVAPRWVLSFNDLW